jgi:hypothetical protein
LEQLDDEDRKRVVDLEPADYAQVRTLPRRIGPIVSAAPPLAPTVAHALGGALLVRLGEGAPGQVGARARVVLRGRSP